MAQISATDFAAWVGAITAGLVGIAVAIGRVLEALGMRPQDRRESNTRQIKELQEKCDELTKELNDVEGVLRATREDLRDAWRNVDFMERLLNRQGWRKGPNGWELDR